MSNQALENPWSPPDDWVQVCTTPVGAKRRVRLSVSAGAMAYRVVLDAPLDCVEVDGIEVHLVGEQGTPESERGTPLDVATWVYGRATEYLLAAKRVDGSGYVRLGKFKIAVFEGPRECGTASCQTTRASLLGEDTGEPTGNSFSEQLILGVIHCMQNFAKDQSAAFTTLQKSVAETHRSEREGHLQSVAELNRLTRELSDLRASAAADAAAAESSGGGDVLVDTVVENLEGLIELGRMALDSKAKVVDVEATPT